MKKPSQQPLSNYDSAEPLEQEAPSLEPSQDEPLPELSELEQLEVDLKSALADKAELEQQLLRTLADKKNHADRLRKEMEQVKLYASEKLAQDCLVLLDNLDLALQAFHNSSESENPALQPLIQGVDLSYKSFLSTLSNHKISEINPALGEAFNPNLHEALSQISSDVETGSIAAVFQKGYLLHDRLLRPARVAVAE